jgi:uncharacterized membrane protein YozB (DUF420 family)
MDAQRASERIVRDCALRGSLTSRFATHHRVACLTFPVWFYVSITGAVVFVFLKAYAA